MEYENHFDSDALNEVQYDGSQNTVKINNPTKGKAKHYESSVFNKAYLDFICARIEANELECDPDLHLQALDAMNVIYLDIDCYYGPNCDPEEFNKNNAKLYSKVFIESNGLKPVNVFIFIPSVCNLIEGRIKGGAHVFIYLDSNVDKDRRHTMYNTTRQKILTDDGLHQEFAAQGIDVNAGNYSKIFDEGPIQSCSALLPFAVKMNATRSYILSNFDEIDTDCETFIIANKHAEIKLENDEEDDIVLEDEEVDLKDEIEYTTSSAYKETLHFVHQLRYLCPRHPFWNRIHDHNSRQQIFKPIFHWLMLCLFSQDPRTMSYNPTNRIKKQLSRELLPLILMTNGPNDKGNTLKELQDYIESICCICYSDGGAYRIFIDEDLAKACKFVLDKPEAMIAKSMQAFAFVHYKDMTKEDRDREAQKLSYNMRVVRSHARMFVSNYSNFVTFISENLSEEIRPFGLPITDEDIAKGYKISMNARHVQTDEVRAGVPISFDELRKLKLYEDVKRGATITSEFYDEFMTTMLRMFICIYFYNIWKALPAVRKAISTFVAYFVFTKRDGPLPMPRIYNIRQTRELCKYPFNQWLPPDEKGSQLIDWFSEIYNDYIDSELNTSRKHILAYEFIEIQRMFQTSPSVKAKTDIKPISNLASGLKSIKDDIMLVHYKRKQDPIEHDPTVACPYHPMRNGILEFIVPEYPTDGRNWREYCRFHTDNYDIILNGTSNIFWDEMYPFEKHPAYARMLRAFREIQTQKSMYDYEMQACSSVLQGVCGKDQIHQDYGTGSEGKTLWNNAIMMMLGHSSLPIAIQKTVIGDYYPEGMNDTVMINPLPLACTINAKFIMTENKSGHDAGGLIELKGKRFCSVAEIDVQSYGRNLQVGICKQITGENPINSRQIHEKSESLLPRIYMTLQTNNLLGYSENNDAIVRRFAVIEHTSKFKTRALADIDNRKGRTRQFEADTTLGSKLQTDPAYWQAVFYILLPYARKFIGRWYDPDEDKEAINAEDRTGGHEPYGAISSIPKPERVERMTRISIKCSSGLVGWLAKNLPKVENALITVKRVIDTVIQTDKNSIISKDGGILDGKLSHKPEEAKRNEIARHLSSQFGSSWLFKLRDEFWDGDKLKDEISLEAGAYEVIDRAKIEEMKETIISDPPRKTLALKKALKLKRSDLHLVPTEEDMQSVEDGELDSDAMIDLIFQDGMSIADIGAISNLEGVYIIDHTFVFKPRDVDEDEK